MRILVDEDLASDELMARLRKAGHQFETFPRGTLDPAVWRHAQEHALVLLTRNAADFIEPALATPQHPGMLMVYGERENAKSMTPVEIADAIEFIREVHGESLIGERVLLNVWRRPRSA